MKEILDFLAKSPAFHVATAGSDGLPQVRPFSFVMEWDGLLTFATSTEKPVYRQLHENPFVAVSSFDPAAGEWMRITGKICFITGPAVKARVLEVMPTLKGLYTENDPRMICFSIIDGEAATYSFASPEALRVVPLSRI